MNKDIIIGFIAIVALVLGGWALSRTGAFSNGVLKFGTATTATGMLAENYVPYVMYNNGYNSAKDIATTGNINGAIGTFSGAFSAAATTLSGLLTTDAGELHSYSSATTTMSATETLVLADVNAYDTVILNPNVAGNTTLTLFASSTASTWLPTAGDSQKTCFVNGTTTANVNYIFAGGTGTTLLVASSSATVLGSKQIAPQKMGCFTFTRGNSTATTFDILSAYTAFN